MNNIIVYEWNKAHGHPFMIAETKIHTKSRSNQRPKHEHLQFKENNQKECNHKNIDGVVECIKLSHFSGTIENTKMHTQENLSFGNTVTEISMKSLRFSLFVVAVFIRVCRLFVT